MDQLGAGKGEDTKVVRANARYLANQVLACPHSKICNDMGTMRVMVWTRWWPLSTHCAHHHNRKVGMMKRRADLLAI